MASELECPACGTPATSQGDLRLHHFIEHAADGPTASAASHEGPSPRPLGRVVIDTVLVGVSVVVVLAVAALLLAGNLDSPFSA